MIQSLVNHRYHGMGVFDEDLTPQCGWPPQSDVAVDYLRGWPQAAAKSPPAKEDSHVTLFFAWKLRIS